MRLTVAPDQPRIEGAGLDFRDEIMAQIYDRGDVRAKRTLTFNIDITDDRGDARPAVPRATHLPGLAPHRNNHLRPGGRFHTMAISSSISVIRRSVTTKTIPQPPRASTDERCAKIIASVPKRRHHNREAPVFKFAAVLLLLSWPASARTATIRSPNGQDYRRMIAPRIYPICLTRLRWPRRSPPRGRHSIARGRAALRPCFLRTPTRHPSYGRR